MSQCQSDPWGEQQPAARYSTVITTRTTAEVSLLSIKIFLDPIQIFFVQYFISEFKVSGSVSHSYVTEWVSLQDPQNTEMQDWTELSPTRCGARRGGARSRDTRSLLRPKLAQPSAWPRLRGGGDGTDPGRRTTPGSSSTAEVDTVSSIMTP